jgi:YVTN family beta-propeller protein
LVLRFVGAAAVGLALLAGTGSATSRRAVALVTAESLNQLVAVDLPSGRVLRRLPLPPDPENVESETDLAVVVSPQAGAVSIVDAHRLRVIRILRGFGAPHIAAFSRDGKLVYVTDDARGQLAVIRLACRCVVRKVFVGLGAHHLSQSPDGRRLWVVLGEQAQRVAVVDTSRPERPRLLSTFAPPGAAHDVAFSPDGTRVWLTFSDRETVAVLNARTQHVARTIPAGSPPQHVAFGRYVYVTSGNDGVLRLFSRRTGGLVDSVSIPSGSYNLGLAGGLVATSSLRSGVLTELESSGRRIVEARVAPAARDVALVLP